MHLVRIHGVDDVRIDQVDEPTCGPDDVVVDVVDCGICGSDLGYIAMGGLMGPGKPMPIGHELAGRVAEVGHNVEHVVAGERVVVQPTANGTDIGNGGPEGGFAPQLLVTNVANHPTSIMAIPDSISYEQGALVEPLSVAMHGVHQSGITAATANGQTVCVFGAGPIGLCSVAVLAHYGIENIVVADLSAHRLGVARELGASHTCAVGTDDLAALLSEVHGTSTFYGMPIAGTDVYIEATGAGPVFSQAIDLAKPGATITVVGLHKSPVEFHPLNLMMKELHLTGSMAYPTEFPEVIEMLATGTVDVAPLISHRFALPEFDAALATAQDTSQSAKVMIKIQD